MTATDAYFEPSSILHPTKTRGDDADELIEWKAYPRIRPGEYRAYCSSAARYWDPGMRRWTCLLRWDVFENDVFHPIAQSVPLWLSLGDGEKPRASRRGKYLKEWARAYGAAPEPKNRLSPRVFTRRIARVEIGDTESPAPYSVVKKIIEWETGYQCHVVCKSTNQVRPAQAHPVQEVAK
jgi:hypothetical protein